MPGVSKASFLDRLHSTASEVAALHAEQIAIDAEKAGQLGQELGERADEVQASALKALSFPVRFDDVQAEVNFLALYHLLNFGSGWDAELRASSRRDAAETVQFALLGMHISGQRMDAQWMKAFSLYQVNNYFGINSHVNVPVAELPGVVMSRPGPLQPLVVALQQAVVQTGEALLQEGSPSLGAKIMTFLADAAAAGRPPSASDLVEELSTSLPGFEDTGLCEGRRVDFARKAQTLVGALHARFAPSDVRFAFPDVGALTADSGPAAAAALRSLQVLRLPSPALAATIDGGEELPPGPEERALRCAAIAAADAVVAASGRAFSAFELGCYLSGLAEEKRDGQDAQQQQHAMPGGVHKHRTKCKAY